MSTFSKRLDATTKTNATNAGHRETCAKPGTKLKNSDRKVLLNAREQFLRKVKQKDPRVSSNLTLTANGHKKTMCYKLARNTSANGFLTFLMTKIQ